jgi:hypothetical protein
MMLEWLRELIKRKSATSLNTGEHVTSSGGGYYSNNTCISFHQGVPSG